ncbi:MAG TPA: response regulator [Thermoanaerobaculia bacterium]|nr:response regulator [Thermoanaerobaculia bacterium]
MSFDRASTGAPSPAGFDVLVVEDDADVREALLLLLEDEGVHAVGATDGHDALDKIARGFRPSLILLDLMMPVMDGELFLRARKADPRLASIPVVIVSAMQRMKVAPEEYDVDEMILKPIDPARVLETVRQYRVQ